jgi:hypothetical protein
VNVVMSTINEGSYLNDDQPVLFVQYSVFVFEWLEVTETGLS